MKTHLVLAKYCPQCFALHHPKELVFEGEATLPETVELNGETFQFAGSYTHPDGD